MHCNHFDQWHVVFNFWVQQKTSVLALCDYEIFTHSENVSEGLVYHQ